MNFHLLIHICAINKTMRLMTQPRHICKDMFLPHDNKFQLAEY